jgi:hypothetical protein
VTLGWFGIGLIHPHEVFHLTVLLAAWFHWRFVWKIAAGGWTMVTAA